MFDHELQDLRLQLLRIAVGHSASIDGGDAAAAVEAASCFERYILSDPSNKLGSGNRVCEKLEDIRPTNPASLDLERAGGNGVPFSDGDGCGDVHGQSGGGVVGTFLHEESPVVGIDTATVSEGGDGVKLSPPVEGP